MTEVRQKRGEELRRHILVAAKDLFLETGYERTSMDLVAARAGTSKRSLYTRWSGKDELFLSVLDLSRELMLDRLGTPDGYSDDPAEAAALFCGRYLQVMAWEPQVRTCRLCVAEAERLPASARAYYETVFLSTRERLSAHLAEHFAPRAPDEVAGELLSRTVLPRLFRMLLHAEEPRKSPPELQTLATDVDLDEIRRLVASVPGKAAGPR